MGAAQLASVAAASPFLPPNIRKVMARNTPELGSLRDIRHVVLLMQENRSFDHYFGTLAGVRGFGDPGALALPTGRSVFHQPDPHNPPGYLLPFHLDTRSTNAQKIPSTDHGWDAQHEAWNGGRMDQWLPVHRRADGANGPICMGYYTREDIPYHYALAEAFTICDAYHCSVLGPTWPNRMYWFSGTLDPHGRGGGPVIDNVVPSEGCRWTTYAERLEKAGVSWKVYQQAQGSDGFNMLSNFRSFQDAGRRSPLYVKGLAPCADGQFEYDALNDKLPAVSWLCSSLATCEHPDALPAVGADFIARKLDALAANPEVWAKTVLIINYDENDGLFDHVPPPIPPQGTVDEFVKGRPIGAGFRVPCIIVSPWTTGGWVCSEPFDHTSILQFLERFTGVREPNISSWRRQIFGDLTAAFRVRQSTANFPALPRADGFLQGARYSAEHLPAPSIPGVNQTSPEQEAGRRKRTLLLKR